MVEFLLLLSKCQNNKGKKDETPKVLKSYIIRFPFDRAFFFCFAFVFCFFFHEQVKDIDYVSVSNNESIGQSTTRSIINWQTHSKVNDRFSMEMHVKVTSA